MSKGGDFVLVVDDDPDIREALELLLTEHGHQVVGAADGAQALQRIVDLPSRPCLILLDLMMPGMNGFQLRAALTADARLAEIPIVVITGAGTDVEDRAAGLKLEVLRKPFEWSSVLETVRRFCPPSASAS